MSSSMPAHAARCRRSSRTNRIVTKSTRSARLVSSTIVRNSSRRSCDAASFSGDAEDTVQPLGKLRFAACEGGLERLRLGSSERDRMRTDDTTSGVSTRPEACASSIAGSHTR
jgi:hypothetical protein